jgi:hypothetical protein
MSSLKLSDSAKSVLRNALQEELRQLKERVTELQQDINFLEGKEYTVRGEARAYAPTAPAKRKYKKRGETRRRPIKFNGLMDNVKELIRNTQVPITTSEMGEQLAQVYHVRGANKRKLISSIAVSVKSLSNKDMVERVKNDSGRFIYLWKEK